MKNLSLEINDLHKSLNWLVNRWRTRAYAKAGSSWNNPNGHSDISQRETYKQCADDLAAILKEINLGNEN